ncbi:STAS domain-containing protein [Actinoplanes sp. NPDC023714]|uniref:STAS domain-containing protein n=1 Tax=Actinoplanes sp. NPDC023714 TaxID=3154322 RepID=UPI0033E5E348
MPELRCEVERVGTRLLVRVIGELDSSTAPRIRAALTKCLVEQPDAVVVDLGGIVAATNAALSVLLVVARQAAFWPHTPLLLAVPDWRMAQTLANQHGRTPIFSSVDDALDAEPRDHTHTLGEVLLPAMGAARRARYLAVEACARWGLRGLAPTASIVASELVSNAVKHAATMTDLRFTLGHRFMIIAVRDGSAVLPHLREGDLEEVTTARGLLLVAELSHRWGCAPAEGGKVVWAALRRP